jgi:hypothetical protein
VTGPGGSRWTEAVEAVARTFYESSNPTARWGDADDYMQGQMLARAELALTAADTVFPVGEPDDDPLAAARSFLYGIGHQGECALLCECGLQEARVAVAAVRAAETVVDKFDD